MSLERAYGLKEFNLFFGLSYIACCFASKLYEEMMYGVLIFGSLYVVFSYIEKCCHYTRKERKPVEATISPPVLTAASPPPPPPPPPPSPPPEPAGVEVEPPKPSPSDAIETMSESNVDTKTMKAIQEAAQLPGADATASPAPKNMKV